MESTAGVESAASPTALDYATYERQQNAADLGRPRTADPPAPSTSDSDPGDEAPDTAPAGSPPATPDGSKADGKKPRTLQTRRESVEAEVAELKEQIRIKKALREELAALDAGKTAKPGSDPAPESSRASWERYRSLPGAPKPDDTRADGSPVFPTYEDYLDARADFIVEQRLIERERRAAAEREAGSAFDEAKATIAAYNDRLTKAHEADPELFAKVDPELAKIPPMAALRAGEPLTASNVLMQCIVESEAAPALLVHFSTPEGQKDWSRIVSAPKPALLERAFGRLESRFLAEAERAEGSAGTRVPANVVTKAPPPPAVLGQQPPASVDREAAALKRGDVRAYMAAADAADLARARSR